MKQCLFKSILLLVASAAIVGCSEDVYPDGKDIVQGVDSEKICFVVSDKSASRGGSDVSRRVGGAFLYSADGADSIYVRLTAEEDDITTSRGSLIADIGDMPLRMTCLKRMAGNERSYYFSNIKFEKDPTGVWVSNPPQWWFNGEKNFNFKFYGYAPDDIEGATYIKDETSWEPKLNYQVPHDVSKQSDIIYNKLTPEYIATANETVPLTMAHALANVGFSTGKGMSAGTINKVTVKNVLGNGTLNLADGSWTLDPASSADFTADINKPSSDNFDISNDADGTQFLLLPGCNTEASQVAVDFTKPGATEPTTYYGALADTWEAGKKYRYTITIDPDFEITLEDPTPQDAHYVICKATVTAANMLQGQQWELTATASDGADVTLLPESELNSFQKQGIWIDKVYFQTANSNTPSPTDESIRGERILTGSDPNEVAVFLPENISGKDRTIKLEMKVAGAENILAATEITQVTAEWNNAGFAWEQFENDNAEATWGFSWKRTVVYEKANGWWNWLIYAPLVDDLRTQYNATSYVDLSNTGIIAFWEAANKPGVKVTINYWKLNDLSGLSLTSDNGLTNTQALYDFSGSAITGDFEQAIKDLASRGANGVFNLIEDTGTDDDHPGSAALRYIMRKNKYNLLRIEKRDGDNIVTSESPLIKSSDIVWYLPAVEQFNTPPVEGDPWTGEYWSSTPEGDHNAYTNSGSAGRMEYRKIRACRNKDF